MKLVPSIEIFSYARCTPREHLEDVFLTVFGNQFDIFPALQGRAAERMLVGAIVECQVLQEGAQIISNRPFDTTKGQIMAKKLEVKAMNPMVSPDDFYNSDSVFLGDVDPKEYDK